LKVPFVVRLAASCEGDDCVDETFPSVVLYKTFDEGRAIHSGSFNVHLVRRLVSEALHEMLLRNSLWVRYG
jgi:hypothetical protein